MADTSTEDQRISELLWRTIKLRVSLLVIAIAAMLIVWSAVLSGDQRAKAVDVGYCQKLLAEANGSAAATTDSKKDQTRPMLDKNLLCSDATARRYIEGMRAFNSALRQTDDGHLDAPAIKFYSDRQRFFSEYDSKRKLSYNFPIQLSSEVSSGEMLVNALTVAEAIPFVTLLIAAVVIILGFQQRAYKTHLIRPADNDKNATALTLARTQFFAFSTFAHTQNARMVKWPPLSAEGVTLWSLAAAFVGTFAGLLFAFAENVIHLTDSVISTYTFSLCWVAFILALWLVYTRTLYDETLEPHRTLPTRNGFKTPPRLIAERLLVVLALASLLLPWALSVGGLSLKGYFFLFPEHVRTGIGGSQFFVINLRVFSELRWQLALALMFILLCGIESFLRRAAHPVRRWLLHALRGSLGILTLMYSLNLLLHMGILEYEAIHGTSWGLHNMIFGSLSGGTPGWPLDLYDPSYGFFIFLSASFALIWLSLANS